MSPRPPTHGRRARPARCLGKRQQANGLRRDAREGCRPCGEAPRARRPSRITYRQSYVHLAGPWSLVMSHDHTWLGPVATSSGLTWAGWLATRRRSRSPAPPPHSNPLATAPTFPQALGPVTRRHPTAPRRQRTGAVAQQLLPDPHDRPPHQLHHVQRWGDMHSRPRPSDRAVRATATGRRWHAIEQCETPMARSWHAGDTYMRLRGLHRARILANDGVAQAVHAGAHALSRHASTSRYTRWRLPPSCPARRPAGPGEKPAGSRWGPR